MSDRGGTFQATEALEAIEATVGDPKGIVTQAAGLLLAMVCLASISVSPPLPGRSCARGRDARAVRHLRQGVRQ